MPSQKKKFNSKPGQPLYEKAASQLARDYCPRIRPCASCKYPVVSGYCCRNCGCGCGNSEKCECSEESKV